MGPKLCFSVNIFSKILVLILAQGALSDIPSFHKGDHSNKVDKTFSENSAKSEDLDSDSLEPRWGPIRDHNKETDFSSEKLKKWNEMAVWGKRDGREFGLLPAYDGSNSRAKALFGEDDLPLSKKWKEMAVWGKRQEGLPSWNDGSSSGTMKDLEKRWKEMSVWGKRDSLPEVDKKWKEMAVWGKRDVSPELVKKWKEMAVWGKRALLSDLDKRWKEMSVWGKRNSIPDLDKRRWEEMSVWGKRDAIPDLDKRWKEMSVWGKRDSVPDLDKRRWEEMSVWGKRSPVLDMDKKWNEMAVWGKRSLHDLPLRNYLHSLHSSGLSPKHWAANFANWRGREEPEPVDSALEEAAEEHAGLEHGEGLDDVKHIEPVVREEEWEEDKTDLSKRASPEHLSRVLRQPRGLTPEEQWATVRQLLSQMNFNNNKRPSWSNTGFNAWGKRSSDLDHRDEFESM